MKYDDDMIQAHEWANFIKRTYSNNPSGDAVIRVDEPLLNLANKFIETAKFCEFVLDAVDEFEGAEIDDGEFDDEEDEE
jgi:hypothetical protein